MLFFHIRLCFPWNKSVSHLSSYEILGHPDKNFFVCIEKEQMIMKTKGNRLLTCGELKFVGLCFQFRLMSTMKNYISFIITVGAFWQTVRLSNSFLSPDTSFIVEFCLL